MSSFLTQLYRYNAKHHLTLAGRLCLLACYPWFKGAWLASFGSRFEKAIASIPQVAGSRIRTSHKLRRSHRNLRVPLQLNYADIASFQEVFWGECYKPPFRLSDARILVDLGANTGMATLYFAAELPEIERILLVEANPLLLSRLERVIQQFGQAAVVEHCMVGGGDAADTEFLVVEDHRLSSGSVPRSGTTVRVPRRRLRTLLDAHGIDRIGLLKCDIEGAEHDLLDDDPAIFQRIDALVAEIHGDWMQREEFSRRLEALGFELIRNKVRVEESDCEVIWARTRCH